MLGVLLMNLGGPDSLDAVRPFLRNLFEDVLPGPGWVKKPLASFIAWQRAPLSRSYYAQIGGSSPLVRHTRAQAGALQRALAGRGLDARCELGMRCWRPFIPDGLAALRAAGADPIVALPMDPQPCRATTGSYFAALDAALTPDEREKVIRIGSYGVDPGYLEATAAAIREKLTPDTYLLFSAHSVPASYPEQGDPYQGEIEATVGALMSRLPPGTRGSLAWQSKLGPVKWLTPATDLELRRLAAEGVKRVLVSALPFTADNIETVQEIDIRYKAVADAAGITHFERARALNDDPQFIAALAAIVAREAGRPGWTAAKASASSPAPVA